MKLPSLLHTIFCLVVGVGCLQVAFLFAQHRGLGAWRHRDAAAASADDGDGGPQMAKLRGEIRAEVRAEVQAAVATALKTALSEHAASAAAVARPSLPRLCPPPRLPPGLDAAMLPRRGPGSGLPETRSAGAVAVRAGPTPPRMPAGAAAGLPPGVGHFKFAGDPKLCHLRKWKWCYLRGNLETLRRAFVAPAVGMVETPSLPLDSAGGAPWQLRWELADEAQRDRRKHYTSLQWWQKINHFPDVRELGNKRFLQRNMKAAVEHFGADVYDIFPLSFQVPADRSTFLTHHANLVARFKARETAHPPLYIMKVGAKDRGEGIRVIAGPDDLGPKDKGIVQSYLQFPYLLNGYKFTMRVYALYTSVEPLRLYLYPEGFVHMATDKYSPDPKRIGERYMHLTNPDINKERPFYKKNPRPFYWNFTELRAYVRQQGDDDVLLWRRIQTLARKTLLSAEHKISRTTQKLVPFRGNCFELVGLDVLVDAELKPWLIEVNPDPDMSAHAGFQLAYEVKHQLLKNTVTLLGLDAPHRTVAYHTSREDMARQIVAAGAAARGTQVEGAGAGEPRPRAGAFRRAGFATRAALGQAVAACKVETVALAMLVVDTMLENERRGDFERLVPSTEDGAAYLQWYYAKGGPAPDQMLACWVAQVAKLRL